MSPIGKFIRSRATGSPGVITGITRDRLSVSFRYAGIVDLPIKKYAQLLEMKDNPFKDSALLMVPELKKLPGVADWLNKRLGI